MPVTGLGESDEVKNLIARGQQLGVLTHDEVAAITADLGLDDTDLEELHGLLEQSEIELIEEIEPATTNRATTGPPSEPQARRAAAAHLSPEMTTDSLQLSQADRQGVAAHRSARSRPR